MKKRIDLDAEVATIVRHLKVVMRSDGHGGKPSYPTLPVARERLVPFDLLYAYRALVEVYGEKAVKDFWNSSD